MDCYYIATVLMLPFLRQIWTGMGYGYCIGFSDDDTIAGMRTTMVSLLLDATDIAKVQMVHTRFAADMDGDGDMDIVSASYDDAIAWYENNGDADPTWTATDIATSAAGHTQYLRQIWMGMGIWISYRFLFG